MSNETNAKASQYAVVDPPGVPTRTGSTRISRRSRPEYEAMLRSVPFDPGWHVLDRVAEAAVSFRSSLKWLVPSGRTTAVDLAPDNVAVVQGRTHGLEPADPIQVQVGTVVDLPLPRGPLRCHLVLQHHLSTCRTPS